MDTEPGGKQSSTLYQNTGMISFVCFSLGTLGTPRGQMERRERGGEGGGQKQATRGIYPPRIAPRTRVGEWIPLPVWPPPVPWGDLPPPLGTSGLRDLFLQIHYVFMRIRLHLLYIEPEGRKPSALYQHPVMVSFSVNSLCLHANQIPSPLYRTRREEAGCSLSESGHD